MSTKKQRIEINKQYIINYMNQKEYKILNIDEIQNSKSIINYICNCEEKKEKVFTDLNRRGCRKCNEIKLKTIPEGGNIIDNETGEEWRPITGGWISNFGNCKNALGKKLTLCNTKYRYNIGGEQIYASRLVAITFKIDNYDKLDNQSYGVSHIDDNPLNNRVDNLIIRDKNEIGKENGMKSRKSDTFKEKIKWDNDRFKNIEYITVNELKNHKIYKNGEINNNDRFLTFTESEGYLQFNTNNKPYKVHRLVCYAFHPIDGKNCLDDYKDLQVNHIDGNKLNNNADNLEWVNQSGNMQHAYDNGLNKKVRNLYQLNENGNIINEYVSISSASRETNESESNIRACCKGKRYSTCKYYWQFKNPEESEEFSKKYNKQ